MATKRVSRRNTKKDAPRKGARRSATRRVVKVAKARPRKATRAASGKTTRKTSRKTAPTRGKPMGRRAATRPTVKRSLHATQSKIVPHLWFDKEAREAAEFYASVFPDSAIDSIRTIRNTPSGDVDVVSFHVAGQDFTAISAGPLFTFNPSISFFLNFDPSRDAKARQNLDATWKRLVEGGKVLMELQEYPFSKHYGWLQDRYGVSWQLILTDPAGEPRPFIVPSLMFTGKNVGRAEEAIRFYTSVFDRSKRGATARYPKGMEPDKEGTVMFADFMIDGQWFAAMDSAHQHGFTFNEAVSLLVGCDSQKEIDAFWTKLSAVRESEQCGWLKDKFGVSWQIVPTEMERMFRDGTKEQVDRVTQAFLPMKKLDIAALRAAYAGSRPRRTEMQTA